MAQQLVLIIRQFSNDTLLYVIKISTFSLLFDFSFLYVRTAFTSSDVSDQSVQLHRLVRAFDIVVFIYLSFIYTQ